MKIIEPRTEHSAELQRLPCHLSSQVSSRFLVEGQPRVSRPTIRRAPSRRRRRTRRQTRSTRSRARSRRRSSRSSRNTGLKIPAAEAPGPSARCATSRPANTARTAAASAQAAGLFSGGPFR